jgi:hypothetical protein
MNWLVPVVLYGWIPLVACAFALLTPPRAVLFSYIAGWLFLPVAATEVLGFFDYNKNTAVPLVVFLAILAFDSRRLSVLHLRWIDVPMIVFCLVPLVSSIDNGLGMYDAFSGVMYQTIVWGLPYVTGRMYFSSPEGMRQLAIALLAGGLVYVPLCLWEIRMSPQLHSLLYGYHQHAWGQTLRSGGYRPMVFMHHGLMVGLWMTAASIVGLALWQSRAVRRLWGMPLSFIVPVLIACTILCKSFGAIALLLACGLCLWAMRNLRTSLPMVMLVAAPSVYVTVRASGVWTGSELTDMVSEISTERAQSLAYRLGAEEQLRARATEKPWFGWAGWGRNLVAQYDDPRRSEMVTTDSLWIIVFGKHGWLGLSSMLCLFFVPVMAVWRRCPPKLWDLPGAPWPWALAMVFSLFALDNLVNAMLNPVYLLIAGALCGLAPTPRRVPARVRTVSRPRSAVAAALAS